ncbi:MAG: hypothetical protein ACOYLS_05275 [Polymorphobacter sp.]
MLIIAAAAPGLEPLRDRIIADSRSMSASSLSFDRSTHLVRTGGGTRTNIARVERWDGRAWTLVSLNGKPPTSSEKRNAEKLAAAAPVPGYHRLAPLLAAASETSTDGDGRTVLRIPVLPPNSVRTDSADISSHLKADVTLSSRGGQVWVERVRVTQREPFKLSALIKVKSFEQVSDYQLDSQGRPRLSSQSADSLGTMFGFSGGEKSEITYSYR